MGKYFLGSTLFLAALASAGTCWWVLMGVVSALTGGPGGFGICGCCSALLFAASMLVAPLTFMGGLACFGKEIR